MRQPLHPLFVALAALLALSAVAAGPAAAATDAENGTTYEAGVTLAFDADGDGWTLRNGDDAFVTEVGVENGTAKLDTGALRNGSYSLLDGDGELRYRFSITGAEPAATDDERSDDAEPVVPSEPASVANGSRYEVGRTLRFDLPDGEYVLRLSGGLFVQTLVAEDGTAELDTDDLSTAEYRLHGPNGTVRYRFELGWGEASDCEESVGAAPERRVHLNATDRLTVAVGEPGFYTLCGPDGTVGATSSPETGGFDTDRLSPGVYRLQDRAGDPVAHVELLPGGGDGDLPPAGPVVGFENGSAYERGARLNLDTDSPLELRRGERFVAALEANATVPTGSLEPGTYRLVADGALRGAFRIVAPGAPGSVADSPRRVWAGRTASVRTTAAGAHTLWSPAGLPVERIDSGGEALTVPTTGRLGEHVLTAPNGTAVARFAVVEQALDARVDGGDFVVASNRGSYPLEVEVNGADAAAVFGTDSREANATERLTPNTTGLAAGTYRVQFSASDADGTANATLRIGSTDGTDSAAAALVDETTTTTSEPAETTTTAVERANATASPGTPGFGVLGTLLALFALGALKRK